MEGLNAAGAKADAVERVAAAKSAKNFMVSNRNLFQWLRMQRVCKRYGTSVYLSQTEGSFHLHRIWILRRSNERCIFIEHVRVLFRIGP